MSFQKILDCLKAERKLRDQQDHDEVKQIFGDKLDGEKAGNIFTYEKNGVIHVCKSPRGIAAYWREFKAKNPQKASELKKSSMEDREHDH